MPEIFVGKRYMIFMYNLPKIVALQVPHYTYDKKQLIESLTLGLSTVLFISVYTVMSIPK